MAEIDPSLLRRAADLVRRGDVIWDIGANIGLFALAAAVRSFWGTWQSLCFRARCVACATPKTYKFYSATLKRDHNRRASSRCIGDFSSGICNRETLARL